ncbi:hypothetical protein BD560DRAFT_297240, partial [Blakeslea trispora]
KDCEHKIILKPNALPVRSRPYKLSWEEDEYLRNELNNLLKMGLIRRSRGEWCSPLFFIKKIGNAGLRMVYDLRQLNQWTLREDVPIPRIQDLL